MQIWFFAAWKGSFCASDMVGVAISAIRIAGKILFMGNLIIAVIFVSSLSQSICANPTSHLALASNHLN